MKHYIGICLILVTVTAIGVFALRSCQAAADQTINQVRDAFNSVLHLQPQVSVNERIVLNQTAPIAELAVVTKEELVTIGFNEHIDVLSLEVPLTEKKLTAEATYRLKAGFDLKKPFSVVIDPATHHVSARMPHAEILSVEQIGDITYHGEDAVLNRVTDADRVEILSSLNSAAHAEAENSGLRADAELEVTQRLNELMAHNGQTVQMEWQGSTPVPAAVP